MMYNLATEAHMSVATEQTHNLAVLDSLRILSAQIRLYKQECIMTYNKRGVQINNNNPLNDHIYQYNQNIVKSKIKQITEIIDAIINKLDMYMTKLEIHVSNYNVTTL